MENTVSILIVSTDNVNSFDDDNVKESSSAHDANMEVTNRNAIINNEFILPITYKTMFSDVYCTNTYSSSHSLNPPESGVCRC